MFGWGPKAIVSWPGWLPQTNTGSRGARGRDPRSGNYVGIDFQLGGPGAARSGRNRAVALHRHPHQPGAFEYVPRLSERRLRVAKIEDFQRCWPPDTKPEQRKEALMFIVHFVGDMHQPLHCSDNKDKGGNDIKLLFFDKPIQPA